MNSDLGFTRSSRQQQVFSCHVHQEKIKDQRSGRTLCLSLAAVPDVVTAPGCRAGPPCHREWQGGMWVPRWMRSPEQGRPQPRGLQGWAVGSESWAPHHENCSARTPWHLLSDISGRSRLQSGAFRERAFCSMGWHSVSEVSPRPVGGLGITRKSLWVWVAAPLPLVCWSRVAVCWVCTGHALPPGCQDGMARAALTGVTPLRPHVLPQALPPHVYSRPSTSPRAQISPSFRCAPLLAGMVQSSLFFSSHTQVTL